MKKKAIVIFADMRTTFDTSFYNEQKEKVSEKFIEFAKKISAICKVDGVDKIILSTITNHKRHEDTMDINYSGFIKMSWCLSCFVEGIFISETSEMIEFENAKLGKSLYKDGYAVLNKKDGFGKYKMDEFSDDTELTQKAINYITELEEEYDIDKLFVIDDQVNTTFHKDAALDDEVIKNTLDKQIVKIRPCLPYHNGPSTSSINNDGDCCVVSGKHTIDGVNECLDIYLNLKSLKEKEDDKSSVDVPGKSNAKVLNRKNY